MTLIFNPPTTPRQEQIIRGTILGGSSIIKPKKGRNCYLSMRSTNAKWIEYKAREMVNLTSPAPFTLENTFRWHSMCYPIFSDFREEFYDENNRILKLESLDPLQDIGLGVWYVDRGEIEKGSIIMNTHVWGEKGTKVVVKYFKLLGYKSEIVQENKYWRVKIDQESSRKFLALTSPQLPEFINV